MTTDNSCGCWDCVIGRTPKDRQIFIGMIVCATCGNKRCPHATNHTNPCTRSNDLYQPGSRYGGLPRPTPADTTGK